MRIVAALDSVFASGLDITQFTTSRGGKITLFHPPAHPGYDYVSRIHVHTPNQSKGIGSELMDMAKAHAASHGHGLMLTPEPDEQEDKDRLIEFYRHRGFDGPDEEGQMRWHHPDHVSM